MKDNLSQDENTSSLNDESLDWAKEVYLQLKKKQAEEKETKEKELINKITINSPIKINNIEENILEEQNLQTSQDIKEEEDLNLGDFDDTFTWSAEVLAAQGRKMDQFSLDEIDWLSRLKQGLEKNSQRICY